MACFSVISASSFISPPEFGDPGRGLHLSPACSLFCAKAAKLGISCLFICKMGRLGMAGHKHTTTVGSPSSRNSILFMKPETWGKSLLSRHTSAWIGFHSACPKQPLICKALNKWDLTCRTWHTTSSDINDCC